MSLTPDVPVLIVQAGLFLFNIAVVRYLFVAPFLRIHELRITKTAGLLQKISAMQAELEQKSLVITKALSESRAKNQMYREKARLDMLAKKEELIHAARVASEAAIKEARDDLWQEYDREKPELHAQTRELLEASLQALVG